jgi:type I restriction enzyme S subunit
MTIEIETPSGWAICTIDSVVALDGFFTDGDWVESKDQDPNGGVRLIQLADIGDGEFRNKSARFLTKSKAYDLSCTFLSEGDLLVARMPDPLGRCCIFPLAGDEKYVTVVDVCAIRLGSSPINRKYIMYLVNSPAIRAAIAALQSGSTRKRISRKNLATIDLPLAPINEQHRIIAKIEELFSELDKGIESLKTAREQLKIYRQAVLKHAFEGKLTAQWREENKDKLETADQLLTRIQKEREFALKKLAAGDDSEAKRFLNKISKNTAKHPAADLPHGAIWVSFLELCTFVVDCHNKTAPYQKEGIHLIRTPCIRNGKIYLNEEARFVSKETYEYWARRCPPKPGDIIFTREAPMGEVGIVPPGIKLCMGQRMMLLRPPSCIDSKYLLYCIMEPLFQSRMMKDSIGTGVKHLRVGDVETLCVPLYPLKEQKQIVALVESDLSIIDGQERDIERAIQQSETLCQSILKKAFSGQLVEQNPDDQPASVLLERILADKVKQTPKKKARKRKAATSLTRRKRASA